MNVEKFFHQRESYHASNVTGPHVLPCSHVLSLPYQNRCIFIRQTPECHAAVHYFDYLDFIFCAIGEHGASLYILALFLVAVGCLYLFTILAATADKFFCPALAVISKKLKLSENLAGVTLLAFGNGSPDIFASLANHSGDTELMYSELLGAAAFVTGFIAGIVIIIRPFKIVGRSYVRDILFFSVAVLIINYCMHDQRYHLAEGIVTVLIYFAYLGFVVFDHFRVKKQAKKLRRLSLVVSDSRVSVIDILRKAESLENITEFQIHRRRDSSVILDEDILLTFRRDFHKTANEKLIRTFVQALNPFDQEEWRSAKWLTRTLMILKAPVELCLKLIIPIIDYGEDLHGWSKLLNLLHIFVLPQLLLFVTGYIKIVLADYVPLSLIAFLVSLALSIIVFRSSRNDCPPSYHMTFAAGSFVGSICVIYTTAKEVVCVMKVLGIISDMTDSLVGLLFLAIGNSIGDLFSNISLARQGYQQMAIAACFGGPMFNSLLGVGTTFIVKALNSHDNSAFTREGALGPNCIIFLLLILSFPLTALMFTNFDARRSIGIYMISVYCLFIMYSLLGELEIMHPYGTDHQKT